MLSVTWRMISSKHCLKSSSRTGQIPLSRACLSISFWSSISLRRATSILLAGWGLAFWIQCLPIDWICKELAEWKVWWCLNSNLAVAAVTSINLAAQILSQRSIQSDANLPPWIHSRGGMMALRTSSLFGLPSMGGRAPALLVAVKQHKLMVSLSWEVITTPEEIATSWEVQISIVCVIFAFKSIIEALQVHSCLISMSPKNEWWKFWEI